MHPSHIKADSEELFARMVFNIFVSNDDDHLRDPRLGGWHLSPLYDVVPRPSVAHERFLHPEVGEQGKLATLDNALSRFAAFTPSRARSVEIIRRVWGEVREWKTTFEANGARGQLIDQVAGAFRVLEDIASPESVKETRNGR